MASESRRSYLFANLCPGNYLWSHNRRGVRALGFHRRALRRSRRFRAFGVDIRAVGGSGRRAVGIKHRAHGVLVGAHRGIPIGAPGGYRRAHGVDYRALGVMLAP